MRSVQGKCWALITIQNTSGKVGDPVETPTPIGEKVFKGKLAQIVSGRHHTLALTKDGKIWAFGDGEGGKIGRILHTRARDKKQPTVQIQSVGAKNAVAVFAGKSTSFYVDKKGNLFAFGLNNHG